MMMPEWHRRGARAGGIATCALSHPFAPPALAALAVAIAQNEAALKKWQVRNAARESHRTAAARKLPAVANPVISSSVVRKLCDGNYAEDSNGATMRSKRSCVQTGRGSCQPSSARRPCRSIVKLTGMRQIRP
jgi:hypothetical protein